MPKVKKSKTCPCCQSMQVVTTKGDGYTFHRCLTCGATGSCVSAEFTAAAVASATRSGSGI